MQDDCIMPDGNVQDYSPNEAKKFRNSEIILSSTILYCIVYKRCWCWCLCWCWCWSIYLSIQGNPSISKPEPDGDSTRIKHAKEPKRKCKVYIIRTNAMWKLRTVLHPSTRKNHPYISTVVLLTTIRTKTNIPYTNIPSKNNIYKIFQ